MDFVKGESLTYSNRHQLRMNQTDSSVLPNDIIMRIIREGNGGRYGYTHKNQFNRCVDELDKLNIETRGELEIWFEEEDDFGNTHRDMFHYDGHEDDFEDWGRWYQWGLGDDDEYTIYGQQGFSTGLLAGTPKVIAIDSARMKSYQ